MTGIDGFLRHRSCLLIASSVLLTAMGAAIAADRVRIQRLDPVRMSGNEGAVIRLVVLEAPPFYARRGGRMGFGSFMGQSVSQNLKEGAEIVRFNRLEDPAAQVGELLLERLSRGFDLIQSEKPEHAAAGRIARGTLPADPSEITLYVQTKGWGFNQLPFSKRYRAQYSVAIRLIAPGSGEVWAEGYCSLDPMDEANPPSYQELLQEDGKRLKSDLKSLGDRCAGEISKDILGLTSP